MNEQVAVILELCLFRRAVKNFEGRVNDAIADGWTLKMGPDVRRVGLFRFICLAVLVRWGEPEEAKEE